jgi:hypothetical protein
MTGSNNNNRQISLFPDDGSFSACAGKTAKVSREHGNRKKICNDEMNNPDFIKTRKRILDLARDIGLNVVDLKINSNIQMLASVDSRRNLRLQVGFLKAEDDVLRSLFKCMVHKGKPADSKRVNEFINANPPGKVLKDVPPNLLKDCYGPKGDCYDLEKVLEKIMKEYTGYIPGITITWRKKSAGKNSITWATFRDLGNGGLIRVNKVLDDPEVPRFVVESIIFHELLHHEIPPEAKGRGNHPHTPRFKATLKKFPHIEDAEEWKKGFFNRKRKQSKKAR